ncbi:MAG: hypothetical protein FWE49_04115, partial [Synergistaceae bacterium]|nr:hypothetical protein [Synergistaceae bacterium]
MKTRAINWLAVSTVALLLTMIFVLPSGAISSNIIESEIEGAEGFRFEKLMFESDHITFDIVNMTNENVKFSAMMSFVDIRGRVVAEVNLLPRRIAANSKFSYKSFFVSGSGEAAKRSDK